MIVYVLSLCGLLGITTVAMASWAVAERAHRARLADELSRLKSYTAILQKRAPRMPGPSSAPTPSGDDAA